MFKSVGEQLMEELVLGCPLGRLGEEQWKLKEDGFLTHSRALWRVELTQEEGGGGDSSLRPEVDT